MIKKTLIALFIAVSIIFPITKAFALVPLAFLFFAGTAAESTFVPWAVGVGAAAVLGLAAWIGFQDTASPSKPTIAVQIDPNTPLMTPQGWAGPNSPPATADATAHQACARVNRITEWGPTVCAASQTEAETAACGGFPNQGGQCSGGPDANRNVYPIEGTPQCPSGYTASGSGCQLSDPAAVKKPPKGKDEIIRNGNNFQRDPRQNEADKNDNLQVSGNQISYTDNKTGEKMTITLSPTTGTATVTHIVPNTSNGTTTHNSSDFSQSGANTGNSQQTYQGTGTQQGNTPSNGVTFPSDYAKTGEAQTAANSIIAKLDPLTSTTGSADGSATDPTFSQGFGNTFAALNGWQLPLHTSTCPTGQFTVWSTQFNMNSQCEVLNQVKQPLSVAMIAVWVILALFIVLGA